MLAFRHPYLSEQQLLLWKTKLAGHRFRFADAPEVLRTSQYTRAFVGTNPTGELITSRLPVIRRLVLSPTWRPGRATTSPGPRRYFGSLRPAAKARRTQSSSNRHPD